MRTYQKTEPIKRKSGRERRLVNDTRMHRSIMGVLDHSSSWLMCIMRRCTIFRDIELWAGRDFRFEGILWRIPREETTRAERQPSWTGEKSRVGGNSRRAVSIDMPNLLSVWHLSTQNRALELALWSSHRLWIGILNVTTNFRTTLAAPRHHVDSKYCE